MRATWTSYWGKQSGEKLERWRLPFSLLQGFNPPSGDGQGYGKGESKEKRTWVVEQINSFDWNLLYE